MRGAGFTSQVRRDPHALFGRLLAGALGVLVLASCTFGSSDGAATPSQDGTTTPTPSFPAAPAPAPTPEPTPEAALGAFGVSAGHPLAARAGMEMLERGGSAVDAAVAAAFADAAVHPAYSGLGGGGAALVVDGPTRLNYDYREVVNQAGTVPADGTGIPGFVAGMSRLHAEHGHLPWAVLLEPAIRFAENGAPVSSSLAGTIATDAGRRALARLPHFQRPGGGLLVEGDVLVQRDLATTLRTLAATGADAFYRGELVAALTAVPGIDAGSLDGYAVQVGAPASGPVGDYTMLSAAPALPGAAIIQMVQIAEAAGIGAVDPASAEFVDLQSQAWRVADRSVQDLLGDPAFVDVPVDQLTNAEANAALASGAGLRDPAAVAAPPGPGNTTHISVVDADGFSVSMTNTVTNFWGSERYVAGFFLNDQLSRFGDVAGEPNVPGPGRRTVTWSAPTTLLDASGRPVLVLGTPGGRQIPNTIAQVVALWALHDQNLDVAVTAERFFLNGGQLRLESSRLSADLTALGYDVRVTSPGGRSVYGSVQALDVDWEAGTVAGFVDPRRSAGYETATRP